MFLLAFAHAPLNFFIGENVSFWLDGLFKAGGIYPFELAKLFCDSLSVTKILTSLSCWRKFYENAIRFCSLFSELPKRWLGFARSLSSSALFYLEVAKLLASSAGPSYGSPDNYLLLKSSCWVFAAAEFLSNMTRFIFSSTGLFYSSFWSFPSVYIWAETQAVLYSYSKF